MGRLQPRLGRALLERYCALDRIDPETTIRAFFELYAEGQGKPRWGDKTPNYVKRMKQIDRWIPEARFIHMIRDGRDAALSRFKRILKDPPPTDVVAERWVRKIEGARADAADLDYIEVQYEALVRDTEPELRRIAEFLELPWDDAMLRYYERAEERLAEMHRDLPGAEGKPLRPADHRKEAHVADLEAAGPEPARALEAGDGSRRRRRLRERRRRRCCSSSATRSSAIRRPPPRRPPTGTARRTADERIAAEPDPP